MKVEALFCCSVTYWLGINAEGGNFVLELQKCASRRSVKDAAHFAVSKLTLETSRYCKGWNTEVLLELSKSKKNKKWEPLLKGGVRWPTSK